MPAFPHQVACTWTHGRSSCRSDKLCEDVPLHMLAEMLTGIPQASTRDANTCDGDSPMASVFPQDARRTKLARQDRYGFDIHFP